VLVPKKGRFDEEKMSSTGLSALDERAALIILLLLDFLVVTSETSARDLWNSFLMGERRLSSAD
jgi:hypothetical protein